MTATALRASFQPARTDRPGFFSRLSQAIQKSRLEKVQHEIPVYMAALDDLTLRSAGYSDAQIHSIRRMGLLR